MALPHVLLYGFAFWLTLVRIKKIRLAKSIRPVKALPWESSFLEAAKG
jgi:hypothetical protein